MTNWTEEEEEEEEEEGTSLPLPSWDCISTTTNMGQKKLLRE